VNIIEEIKESWGWVGIDPEEVVGENDFGNLIIKDTNGTYWRLCPEDIYCKIVANSREELDQLSADPGFLEDWYMESLVEQANEKLGPLHDGCKYCLVTPGPLGGDYGASNIQTASQEEIIRLSGHLGEQIKDLPEGAKIKLEVTE
jgi:hypothetical protein